MIGIERSTPTHMYRIGVETISKQLASLGLKRDRVVLRQFSPERMPQMLATGTDRDDRSKTWSVAKYDSDDSSRQRAGVSPAQVTYGVDVSVPRTLASGSWAKFPREAVPGTSLALAFDYMSQRGRPIAVYDRSALVRASAGGKARASKVEFWFKHPARDGLLLVLQPTSAVPASSKP